MNKAAFIIFLAFGFAAPSAPQSAADLSARYSVVTSYEIRPGILMTPRYTAVGQVCEMSIQRQIIAAKSGIYLDASISDELIKEIVDELAPPTERGKSLDDPEFSRLALYSGVSKSNFYSYENVDVDVATRSDTRFGPLVILITWKNRTCKGEERTLPREQHSH
jgi:hypothetical protein